jgi:hypothetical protein
MRIYNSAPSASSFIESLRDIGYTFETAISDIIDNSITAKATHIYLNLSFINKLPVLSMIDDGVGMDFDELLAAMKPGSKNPLDFRELEDLGRFGLGLKTASYSQCRRLTVVSRKYGITNAATWDLDYVASTNEWDLQVLDEIEISSLPHIEFLSDNGTLVLWENLDRVIDYTKSTEIEEHIYERLDSVRKHIELIFHRFLDGEKPYTKISIKINGRLLEAFNPFNSNHTATIWLPEETIQVQNSHIKVQPFVLPHHKKVSPSDWNKYSGVNGYLKGQGFYVYRSGRLIIHGTWFRLAKQAELTKLSRVRVDMPNELDHLWKIDVKKSSAQPPLIVRERLKAIIARIGGASNRVYTQRGKKLVDPNLNTFWSRRVDKNEITYEINNEHPAILGFYESLTKDQERNFNSILTTISTFLPTDSLFKDIAGDAEKLKEPSCDEDSLNSLLELTIKLYRDIDSQIQDSEILANIEKTEPFKSNIETVKKLLHKYL